MFRVRPPKHCWKDLFAGRLNIFSKSRYWLHGTFLDLSVSHYFFSSESPLCGRGRGRPPAVGRRGQAPTRFMVIPGTFYGPCALRYSGMCGRLVETVGGCLRRAPSPGWPMNWTRTCSAPSSSKRSPAWPVGDHFHSTLHQSLWWWWCRCWWWCGCRWRWLCCRWGWWRWWRFLQSASCLRKMPATLGRLFTPNGHRQLWSAPHDAAVCRCAALLLLSETMEACSTLALTPLIPLQDCISCWGYFCRFYPICFAPIRFYIEFPILDLLSMGADQTRCS